MIRIAKEKDLKRIQEIYVYARKFMAEHGNPTQWGQTHPTEDTLRKDIEKEQLYVIEEQGKLQGVFALIIGDDPTYRILNMATGKIRVSMGRFIGSLQHRKFMASWRRCLHLHGTRFSIYALIPMKITR